VLAPQAHSTSALEASSAKILRLPITLFPQAGQMYPKVFISSAISGSFPYKKRYTLSIH
jgi:hypothetical protein